MNSQAKRAFSMDLASAFGSDRRVYERLTSADPMECFKRLFAEAEARESFDATRAALATFGPSVRFILVREVDEEGFSFFTDYRSDKARELEGTPRAALAYHWASTGVQVRIEGPVKRASVERSDRYFATRPRMSQVGAWASHQSAPLAEREALEARVAEVEARFAGGPVPRPPHWGGFTLQPMRIEFWFAQEARLHDRFRFDREGPRWVATRLCP